MSGLVRSTVSVAVLVTTVEPSSIGKPPATVRRKSERKRVSSKKTPSAERSRDMMSPRRLKTPKVAPHLRTRGCVSITSAVAAMWKRSPSCGSGSVSGIFELAARGGAATMALLRQRLIERDIVERHAACREALLEAGADRGAVEPVDVVQHRHRLVDVVDDEASEAVLDDLRGRAVPEGDDRHAARHGLDHDETEGLRPADRKQQGARLAEEGYLGCLVDLADELDRRVIEERGHDLGVISFVDAVDFGRDLEPPTAALGDADGRDRVLLGRDAAEKGEVAFAVAPVRQGRNGDAVMHRAEPICFRQEAPLRLGDRDDRELTVLREEEL